MLVPLPSDHMNHIKGRKEQKKSQEEGGELWLPFLFWQRFCFSVSFWLGLGLGLG